MNNPSPHAVDEELVNILVDMENEIEGNEVKAYNIMITLSFLAIKTLIEILHKGNLPSFVIC